MNKFILLGATIVALFFINTGCKSHPKADVKQPDKQVDSSFIIKEAIQAHTFRVVQVSDLIMQSEQSAAMYTIDVVKNNNILKEWNILLDSATKERVCTMRDSAKSYVEKLKSLGKCE